MYLFTYCLPYVYVYFIHKTSKILFIPLRANFYSLGSVLPLLRMHSIAQNYEFSKKKIFLKEGGGKKKERKEGREERKQTTNNKTS